MTQQAQTLCEALQAKKYRGIIFDLDGVLVSTDDCHYRAWKKMADEEGIYFDRTINERLRGVSRMASLEIILERAKKTYTDEEKVEMATRKNEYYKQLIQTLTPEAMLPGALAFVHVCRDLGIRVAIGSSSKNTRAILTQIGQIDGFDAIADGNDITRSKPAPDVFLIAAHKLNLPPESCMVVEDADAGVEAARAAGMDVLAVGYASANPDAIYHMNSLAQAMEEIEKKQ